MYEPYITFEELSKRAAATTDGLVVVSLKDLEEANRQMFEMMRAEMLSAVRYMTQAKFMTRKQVAEILHVNLSTLTRWNARGILRYYKSGGKVQYRSEDVAAMMNMKTKELI